MAKANGLSTKNYKRLKATEPREKINSVAIYLEQLIKRATNAMSAIGYTVVHTHKIAIGQMVEDNPETTKAKRANI